MFPSAFGILTIKSAVDGGLIVARPLALFGACDMMPVPIDLPTHLRPLMYSISLSALVQLARDHRPYFLHVRFLEVSCHAPGVFDNFWILCFAVSDLWMNRIL